MIRQLLSYIISVSIVILLYGCAGIGGQEHCKPVLQPYGEFGLKADPKGLPGIYASKTGNQRVTYFNLNFDVPAGWHADRVHWNVVRVERIDYCQGFLIIYNQGDEFVKNIQEPDLIGCKNLPKKSSERLKTDKEYYRKLFLFKDDNLDNPPSYWQYWILWQKSIAFRDISALYHYTGRSLEAFQKNTDALTRLSKEKGTRYEVVVFPAKIAPDYLTIVADDLDDKFISDFLDMLNTLNP
jgi:hypothetical protein